jgi:hypothetical protein
LKKTQLVPPPQPPRFRFSPFVKLNGENSLSNLLTGKRLKGAAATYLFCNLPNSFSYDDLEKALKGEARDVRTLFDRLRHSETIVPADDDIFLRFAVRHVDIEITSHCNARCRFCPVSQDPLMKKVMSDDLFALLLERIAPSKPRTVSLNHFNEPLLDRGFEKKNRLLASSGLKLRLFTNGVLLQPTLCDTLKELGNISEIIINLASSAKDEYRLKMGIKMSPRLMGQIRYAALIGLPVSVCVNADPVRQAVELSQTIAAIECALDPPEILYQ